MCWVRGGFEVLSVWPQLGYKLCITLESLSTNVTTSVRTLKALIAEQASESLVRTAILQAEAEADGSHSNNSTVATVTA